MSSAAERPELLVTVMFDDSAEEVRVERALRGQGLRMRREALSIEGAACASDWQGAQVVLAVGRLSGRRRHLLVESLRAGAPAETRIVICTEQIGRRELRQAIECGLDGLVLERDVETALAPTIHAVAAGQIVVPRELRRRIEQPSLSAREKQVLSLVVMGLSNGEIARRLFIGQTTVKTHMRSVFRKLGVSSRAEAAHMITDPDEGLGTGILRITEPAVPAKDEAARSLPRNGG